VKGLNYEGFLELVMRRRSIRSYKTDPIPLDFVQKILEVARWAPSGANTQPWEFIIVTRKEDKNKIVDIIKRNLPNKRVKDKEPKPPEGFKDAPVFIIVCGDLRKKILLPGTSYKMENQKIKSIQNPDLNIEEIFNSNLSNAILYIHLAAKTLGLGSQWVTGTNHPRVQNKIKQLLKIPEYLKIYDTVALGYPATKPKPRFVRKLKEITHYDEYDQTKSITDSQLNRSLDDLMNHARVHLDRPA